MIRHHFVSFGAGEGCWKSSLRRLNREIHSLDPSALVRLFDESSIDSRIGALNKDFREFAKAHPRGYGYWVWKPWVILETMTRANPGDVVIYLDAGCTVNSSDDAQLRYYDYVARIKETGCLYFSQNFLEKAWTKQEVIKHFELNNDHQASGQVFAGIHGHLVCDTEIQFIREWLHLCTTDESRLVVDVQDTNDECNEFIEHRHDQSVLSCLCKVKGRLPIPDETDFFPDWNRRGQQFPFWATRKCSGLPRWAGYRSPMFGIKSRWRRVFRFA